jgi:hypothetical protein
MHIKTVPSSLKTGLLGALALLLMVPVSIAKERIIIQKASINYNLAVQVEVCGGEDQRDNPSICGGPAQTSIYRKKEKIPFQILRLPNVEIDKDYPAYNAQIMKQRRKLYDDEFSIIFDDFNFDGLEDLAICNGRNGGYGAPSYNVYLFNKDAQKFIKNIKLTNLAGEGYLGLFFPDRKNRVLIAYSKSGCCFHETDKFRVRNNQPVLFEKIIEEAIDEQNVIVTTKKNVNGKWLKKVRRTKISGKQSASN